MNRQFIDVVIEEKTALLLDIDGDLERREFADLREDLQHQMRKIIDGELEQLAAESRNYWAQTMEVC